MTKHLLNCSVYVAAATLCLGAMINGTTAGSFTRGCAARNLQILMMFEERESTRAKACRPIDCHPGAVMPRLGKRIMTMMTQIMNRLLGVVARGIEDDHDV